LTSELLMLMSCEVGCLDGRSDVVLVTTWGWKSTKQWALHHVRERRLHHVRERRLHHVRERRLHHVRERRLHHVRERRLHHAGPSETVSPGNHTVTHTV
jgi:hypothetical protein